MQKTCVILFTLLLPLALVPALATVSATPNIGMLRVATFLCPREVLPGSNFPAYLDLEYAVQGLPNNATIRGAIYSGNANSSSPVWQSDPTSVSNGGDQTWNLTLTAPSNEDMFSLTAYAFFLDNGTWNYFDNPVNGPGISQVTVKVGRTASIQVTIGAPGVPIAVNGASEQTSPAGVATFTVPVAAESSVSVPTEVELQNSTRLIFTQWDDGVAQPQRGVQIDGDVNLTASYRTQYLLTVNNGSATQEWYDQGANVTITAPMSLTPPWPLSVFGVTETFSGWSGDMQSRLPQLTVTMNSPKTINADFAIDYLPLAVPVIFALGIMCLIAGLILMRRKPVVALDAEPATTPPETRPPANVSCPKCGIAAYPARQPQPLGR